MIKGLNPYSEYKESDVQWLGKVPAHWHLLRLKRLLRVVDERSTTGEETLLSLRRDHGIVIYSEHFSRPAQGDTTIGYKRVKRGQLVLNRLQANNGLIFDSRYDGLVSPDYSVFATRRPVDVALLGAILRTPEYKTQFRRESTGLGTGSSGFLRLYDDRFLNTVVSVPRMEEQAAIMRFIRWSDRRVRQLIRAKQRLIALLEEQKQAIIHRAVTRGIDQNARLIPSGIDCLENVPSHWQVLPLKRCIRAGSSISYGIVQPGDHVEGGIPFVQTGNLTRLSFDRNDLQQTTPQIAARYPRSVLATGDVLLGIRASVGMAAVAPSSLEGANLSRGIARIVPREGLNAWFLVAYLRSEVAQRFWSTFQQGTTFNEIPIALVRSLPVVLPPHDEQELIVAWISKHTRTPDMAIASAYKEISLTRELRASLIAEVATGKLDVRAAAARLPEDVEEAESFDEAELESATEGSGEEIDAIAGEVEA